jgi:hypothetical protein
MDRLARGPVRVTTDVAEPFAMSLNAEGARDRYPSRVGKLSGYLSGVDHKTRKNPEEGEACDVSCP